MLALPSLSFAAAEPNTQVPAGSRHYAATTVPDRIVASPSADPSHAFAVAWRTDGSVQAPLRTGLEADAGHRGGRLVATAAAVVRVAAGDVAIVRFEAHAAVAHARQQRPARAPLPPGLRELVHVLHDVDLVAAQLPAYAQRAAEAVLVAGAVLALTVGAEPGHQPPSRSITPPACRGLAWAAGGIGRY
ncbi:hypothetical protein G6F60_013892 [Rhizopus arrhizus]|nr:hypothetical protein G6F60_013892 [Rhizopus arrhizus]